MVQHAHIFLQNGHLWGLIKKRYIAFDEVEHKIHLNSPLGCCIKYFNTSSFVLVVVFGMTFDCGLGSLLSVSSLARESLSLIKFYSTGMLIWCVDELFERDFCTGVGSYISSSVLL